MEYLYDDCGVKCRLNPEDSTDIQPVEPYCLNCGSTTEECDCDDYEEGKYFDEKEFNMNCCICLMEQQGKYIQNPNNHYRCPTCVDGLVCSVCLPDFDPTGVVQLVFMDEIIDTIRCPCCRALNWKYYYDCFVSHFDYETGYEAPEFITDIWRTGKNDKVMEILMRNINESRNVLPVVSMADFKIVADENFEKWKKMEEKLKRLI